MTENKPLEVLIAEARNRKAALDGASDAVLDGITNTLRGLAGEVSRHEKRLTALEKGVKPEPEPVPDPEPEPVPDPEPPAPPVEPPAKPPVDPPAPPQQVVLPTVVSPGSAYVFKRDYQPVEFVLDVPEEAAGIEVYSYPFYTGGPGHRPPVSLRAGLNTFKLPTAPVGPDAPDWFALVYKRGATELVTKGTRPTWRYEAKEKPAPTPIDPFLPANPPLPPGGLLRAKGNGLVYAVGGEEIPVRAAGGNYMIDLDGKFREAEVLRVIDMMSDLGFGIVRLPLHPRSYKEHGIGLLMKAVNRALERRMWPIPEYHGIGEINGWYQDADWDSRDDTDPLYDSDDDLFFNFHRDMAPAIRNDGRISVGLFNEPVYKGGGWLPAGDPHKGITNRDDQWLYFLPYYQQAVHIYREAGAHNLLWVGGTHWARIIRKGILNHPLSDPVNNIGIDYHEYQDGEPDNAKWFLGEARDKYPVLIGELGIGMTQSAPVRASYIKFLDEYVEPAPFKTAWSVSTGSKPYLFESLNPPVLNPYGEWWVGRLRSWPQVRP